MRRTCSGWIATTRSELILPSLFLRAEGARRRLGSRRMSRRTLLIRLVRSNIRLGDVGATFGKSSTGTTSTEGVTSTTTRSSATSTSAAPVLALLVLNPTFH